jgi:hypothetical protein
MGASFEQEAPLEVALEIIEKKIQIGELTRDTIYMAIAFFKSLFFDPTLKDQNPNHCF